MGLSEFFHFESECEACGKKCHHLIQAKIPGSSMRDYQIGDRIDDEVLDAFVIGEKEYYSECLGVDKNTIIGTANKLPSFTILPTHVQSHCKSCGRKNVSLGNTVIIEKGVFTEVLCGNQIKGSIMHRSIVVPELALKDDKLLTQLVESIEGSFGDRNKAEETKPCPYCGKPLYTPRAKQCFKCHTDWHDPDNVVVHDVDKNEQKSE